MRPKSLVHSRGEILRCKAAQDNIIAYRKHRHRLPVPVLQHRADNIACLYRQVFGFKGMDHISPYSLYEKLITTLQLFSKLGFIHLIR